MANALASNVESAAPPRRPARESGDRRRRQQAHAFGLAGERAVASYLRAGAYAVLAHRARLARCEVDLIVARDDVVAFVEVKARRRGIDGLEAVTPTKIKRLSRAANTWLAANEAFAQCSIRFDIALVGRDQSIDYLENAYEAVEYDDFCH